MKPGAFAQLAFIVVAAFGVYSFVRASMNDQRLTSCSAMCQLRPAYAGNNRTVPDFELKNMHGEKVRLSSLMNGKPFVLNFWTKTCKPCLEEMPALAEMASLLKVKGIKVITVSTDDGPDAVRDTLDVLLEGHAPPFEILFDPDTEVVTDVFGTTLFPETWLIDGAGVIRARIDGARDWRSPIASEVIDMLGRPIGCNVEFQQSRPVGRYAGLCGEQLM